MVVLKKMYNTKQNTMTAFDLRAAINTELSSMPKEMLQQVVDYVKSLRKKESALDLSVSPLVASLRSGNSVNLSDEEVDILKEEYLTEKYL